MATILYRSQSVNHSNDAMEPQQTIPSSPCRFIVVVSLWRYFSAHVRSSTTLTLTCIKSDATSEKLSSWGGRQYLTTRHTKQIRKCTPDIIIFPQFIHEVLYAVSHGEDLLSGDPRVPVTTAVMPLMLTCTGGELNWSRVGEGVFFSAWQCAKWANRVCWGPYLGGRALTARRPISI